MLFMSRSVASHGSSHSATQSLLLPVLSRLQGWSSLQPDTREAASRLLISSHLNKHLTQDQSPGFLQPTVFPAHDSHPHSSAIVHHHARGSITRGFAVSVLPKDTEKQQQVQNDITSHQERSNHSRQLQSESLPSQLTDMQHQHQQASQKHTNEEATAHVPSQSNHSPDKQQQQQQEEQPHSFPLSQDVVYYGPLASTHKLLKRISISNTVIAFAAAPAIIAWADVSYVSRVGLATSLVLFGILTTGALHWITQPYIHELRFTADTQSFEAKMTSLFGRTRIQHFKLADVQPLPWNRPVATFMANNKFYYIDVYSFPDEELLKRLTPPEDTVPPGYKDDDD